MAVADTHDKDDQHLVMNFVDDPVVTDTQSIGIFPLEFLDTRGRGFRINAPW